MMNGNCLVIKAMRGLLFIITVTFIGGSFAKDISPEQVSNHETVGSALQSLTSHSLPRY